MSEEIRSFAEPLDTEGLLTNRESLMSRVRDLLQRTGVSDAEILVGALERHIARACRDCHLFLSVSHHAGSDQWWWCDDCRASLIARRSARVSMLRRLAKEANAVSGRPIVAAPRAYIDVIRMAYAERCITEEQAREDCRLISDYPGQWPLVEEVEVVDALEGVTVTETEPAT